LFPGVKLLVPERDELVEKIKLNLEKKNLQCTKWFMDKIIQVYEMVLVRHGLMIVGEPLSGKTCAYQVILCYIYLVLNVHFKYKTCVMIFQKIVPYKFKSIALPIAFNIIF